MAFCRRCGNELREGVRFCNKCGTSIQGTPTSFNQAHSPVPPQPRIQGKPSNTPSTTTDKHVPWFKEDSTFSPLEEKIPANELLKGLGLLAVVIVVAIAGYLLFFRGSGNKNNEAPKSDTDTSTITYSKVKPGYKGKLITNCDRCWVATTTEDSLIRLAKASNINDQTGINELMVAGYLRMVTDGTQVLVLDIDGNFVQVRVLDGPDQGEAWWTLTKFVK